MQDLIKTLSQAGDRTASHLRNDTSEFTDNYQQDDESYNEPL